jgi:hypothetical protein
MTPSVHTANAPRANAALSMTARLYVAAVIATGGLVLALFAPRHVDNPSLALTFAAAMLLVSLFKLRLPLGRGQATMSMAYVIDFAVMIMAGVELAMAIAALGVLVQCTLRVRKAQPWYRTAFSVAAVTITVRSAGAVWTAMGGGATAAVGTLKAVRWCRHCSSLRSSTS